MMYEIGSKLLTVSFSFVVFVNEDFIPLVGVCAKRTAVLFNGYFKSD